MSRHVFIVMNGAVLAVYTTRIVADMHALTVTGGQVVPMELLDHLSPAALSDIQSDDPDEWEDELTPVETPEGKKHR